MNAEAELEESLPEFLGLPPDFDQHLEICTLYRRIAIGSLLLSADPALFYENLFKSTRTFLHGLENVSPEKFLTSRFHPFFDALACRDEVALQRMIVLAPREPTLEREYEEDFLYSRIAMDLASGEALDRVDVSLERYRELASGNPDMRLAVLIALRERNAGAFDSAVRDAAGVFEEELLADLDADSADPDEAAFAPISLEVLAWIELAARAELPIARAYPLAPAVARAFHRSSAVAPDAWRAS